jgi:uncharacterized membrane protein YccC
MTQQSALAQSGMGSGQATPGHGRSPSWVSSFRVTWSAAAAVRAVRATIVIPTLFALTYKVIANEQMTVFAVFGGFGALVMTSFGGGRRDKAIAHLGLAVAGTAVIVVGTLVSYSTWLAATVTVPLAFIVFVAGSFGPTAASGVTACLLAYVLPVASAGTASVLPSRLEGWWLAQAASTIAVLVTSSRPLGDRLRARAATLATALQRELDAGIRGAATDEDRQTSVKAKRELRNAFIASPYRPIGLASADQALATVIHVLEWAASLISELIDGHLNLGQAASQDRDLLTESAVGLGQVAALVAGRSATPDIERLWRARQASAQHLHQITGDPAATAVMTDQAFHAQAIGVAVTAAVGEALIAARRESPEDVATERQRWLSGHDDGSRPAGSRLLKHLRPVGRSADIILDDASLRSVWFRNSIRGAIALAAAVAVAKLIDVQHAFWVVLGTLSVLRSSAGATGSTAMRALAGTVVGFAIGAALMIGIGTNPAVLWAVYPAAVLIAAYTPGTAPFAFGQAAFTISIIVLFNVIVPAGWRVGLVRVEDVAIGCAVSLVVGTLFWPRGTLSVVGDNLADALRLGADYLSAATGWALGQGDRPDEVLAAVNAGVRLDDAMRGYLTEQGSKRITKADLWTLTMAATRLRLTAHSMASLPGEALPASRHDDQQAGALLAGQAVRLTGFYDEVAKQVGRPGHDRQPPLVTPGPAGLDGSQPANASYSPETLWVSDHLAHLSTHSADITGPAERLAALRRRPWWR